MLACATVQDPPGGPPDFAPPVLVSVAPDSGSVLTDLKEPAVIRFNEVINERPGATLDQLIIVSPRADELSVSWKRDAIEIRPRGGWRRDVPYRLTLLPGITDLRSNRLTTGRTVIFSTGGPIPATRATGRAIDWEAGGAAQRAMVELTRTSDSLVFWSVADSVGAFEILAVPPGQYVLSATIDRNNNRIRDYREAFDSALVTLDSTLEANLWAVVRDSVGPRLRTTQKADSFAIRLEFTQALAPGGTEPGAIRVRALPDSTPVPVTAIRSAAAYDSARGQRPREPADSLDLPVSAQPAAAAPAPDRGRPMAGVVPTVSPGAPGQRTVGDSVLTALLRTRPRLSTSAIVIVGEPLKPASRYVINASVRNLSGALGESAAVLVVPAEPVRDTTRRDSTRVRP